MYKLEMYILLWAAYLTSIVLMLFDFHFSTPITTLNYDTLTKYWFYLLANGTLAFRLIGVFWFTVVLHAFIPCLVVYFAIFKYWEIANTVPILILWVPLLIQIILSGLLFLLSMSDKPENRGFYSGIHAHLGILVVVVYYWNACHIVKQSSWCGILGLSYMLMFVIIILTPAFQGLGRAVIRMEVKENEPIESITTISNACGPAYPGHRRDI